MAPIVPFPEDFVKRISPIPLKSLILPSFFSLPLHWAYFILFSSNHPRGIIVSTTTDNRFRVRGTRED
jgi:hypothetical protein